MECVLQILDSFSTGPAMFPLISVIVVSDYASGKERGWDDLRATLQALKEQEFTESAEFILVETPELARRIPADVLSMASGLRLVEASARNTHELINAAVPETSAELIAILEGDCAPAPSWLRACVEAMRARPEAAVVSGRTRYPGQSLLNRSMAALSRSFLDSGQTSMTRHLTTNNCVFRRETLWRHPLPVEAGPHMSMLHASQIRAGGGQLWFEPRMEVVHAYSGWNNERHLRHSIGYGVVAVRRADPRAAHTWVTRFGILTIPLFIGLRALNGCWHCIRIGRAYGVRWYELPAAFALAFAATSMEARGMWYALRGVPLPENEYR